MHLSGGGQIMTCVWCGTPGGLVNRLLIELDSHGDPLAECEWCASTEEYRRLGAHGEGN